MAPQLLYEEVVLKLVRENNLRTFTRQCLKAKHVIALGEKFHVLVFYISGLCTLSWNFLRQF